MKVSLKEEYKGRLGLQFDNTTGEFYYTITHSSYPDFVPETIRIEEGDELTVRSPNDGSVVIHRIVEFDFDSYKVLNVQTGGKHQVINGYPITGVLTNIEPAYWVSLFTSGHPADLVKRV